MRSHLSTLFGSEARTAVLARLLLQPESEIHLRDLVRSPGFSPRSISKEVDRLTAAGFLLERRSSNRRYLRANTEHPLFGPVRELLEKTVGIIPALRASLDREEGIVVALLFGSAASGSETAESDIDVLVVGDITLSRVIELTRPVQDRLNRAINPVVMTARECAKRVEDKEHLITSILRHDHVELIGNIDELV